MWIPQHGDHVAAAPHGWVDVFSELRQWSSIIGIVTAIVGNVLISFALNIQRYAHIRIAREYHESNTPLSGGGRKLADGATQQEQIAEERAKINAEAPGPGKADNNEAPSRHDLHGYRDQDAHVTSPLLKTYHSGSTITTLEKQSENGDERKSYLRSPYWWAGIILMTVGEAGNFLAYGFAPASIVSPLGVVALVSNCIIAPIMLKERFRMRDGWGVLVAIAGAVTVVLSAKTSETKFGQDELLDAIMRWEFLTYVGITTGLILVLMFASPRYGDRTILIDLGLVGLFGGYTALSTKGVASLLSGTLWMALTFPITYFLVLILVFSALMQIRYVNRSLQRFDSTQVIPVQFVLFTLSVIIGSAVLYRDFQSTTVARGAKFVGGCLLTFFGVYLITSGRLEDGAEEDDDSIEEEEGIHLVDDEVSYQDRRRLSRIQTGDSNVSPRRTSIRPRTPDRAYSDSATPSNPQSPYTPTPFAFPSATDSNHLETSHQPDTYPSHLQRTPISPAQPSPFTRAQSGPPPQTPTFTRLRPTQSHQQTPATPTTPHPYFRSPSTPTTVDSFRTPATTFLPSRSRPSSPNNRSRAAETALRAHLSPSNGRGEPGPNLIYPPLNRSARGSFGRLLPAPLSSPLSSTLSAVVAESLRRGEGMGAVSGAGVGNGMGRSRGRLSGVRRKGSSKRPAVVGMVSDGRLAGTPAAAIGGQGGQEPLLRGIEEAEPGSEVRKVLGGEASVEAKKGKLQDMSESLSGLVGRRRRGKKKGSRSSGSASSSSSPSPSPAPSSSRRKHDDAAAKHAAGKPPTRTTSI